MTTPSVTLRSLQNEDTGIDISVLRYREEEAPLGGVSILYEIFVLTRLDLFKTRLHKSGDIVHFTIFKAYREIEDLYNKLNKKYPKAGLPPVPKSSTVEKYSFEERVEALNIFVGAVAQNSELCYSSIFTQFIGINSQRLPSFTMPDNELPSTTKMKEENGEMFPKMKNVSNANSRVQVSVPKDLFEEVKISKYGQSESEANNSTPKGLFDDFDDENLFSSSKPISKAPTLKEESPTKDTTAKIEKPTPSVKQKPKQEDVDDSQIILSDRKFGNVSLFKEQDLGESISKEDEALFLVTPTSDASKKNMLLFSDNDTVPDSEKNLNENLDDLLHLEPLPPTEVPPVPRPRRISIEKMDSQPNKPEVAPRKVFLNKPTPPKKPTIPTKPSSVKPVPPTKPKLNVKKPVAENIKDLDLTNGNQSNNSSVTNQLQDLDILKYIEQEEKSLDSSHNLFD